MIVMEAKLVIGLIRTELEKAKKSGIQFIDANALLTYLSELERAAPAATEAVKFQHESELAFRRLQHESSLEMFRSVIESGKTALKTCILVNGGAAIALLAFIGNIFSKSQVNNSVPQGLANALLDFSGGVWLGALSSGLTYLSQGGYHRNCPKMARVFNSIGISFVAIAYILFGVGVFAAYHAFVK